MSIENRCVSILALVLAAGWLNGCSNGGGVGGVDAAGGGPRGSGGSTTTGGTVEIGGSTGNGSQASTGGASGGGSAGSVGIPMTGGATMTGGSTTGGGPGSGGTTDASIDASGDSDGSRADGGVDAATGGSDANTSTGVGGTTGAARTITNLYYAGTTSASQSLDLLLPANARVPLPLVIRFHGGGFSGGDKAGEESGTAARAILAKGYALASVNYRLSGGALFPAGAKDAKAAVRWLRAHAAEYGLDATRFASWGESAGGYMAVMLGVTGDQATIFDDDSLGNPGVSSAVQSVVDWYGPTNLATMDMQQIANPPASCPSSWLKHTPAGSPEGQWLGGALITPGVSTKLMQANLPVYITTAKTLPLFVIAHGDNDCQVPWGQAQELKDALATAGNTANLTIIAGGSHSDARFESTQSTPAVTLLASVFGR